MVSNSVLAHEDNPRLLKSILKNSYLNIRENEFSKDTYIKMIEETSHSSKKESTRLLLDRPFSKYLNTYYLFFEQILRYTLQKMEGI